MGDDSAGGLLSQRMAHLQLQGSSSLQQRLSAAGAQPDEAEACAKLFSSFEEALPFISRSDDGRRGYKSPWQEYYSLKYQRFYYCNDAIGYNSWDMPPQMQLGEWMVDVGLYGVDVVLARDVYDALSRMMSASWHRVGALWEGVAVMSKLVGNVSGCSNTVEKYRHIKMDNPKVKDKVLSLPGALLVLELAGFVKGSVSLSFPGDSAATAALLKPLALVAARLDQLHLRRGFTGSAKEVDDVAGSSGSVASKHSGKPGFRYQQLIHECALCAAPINDGTDRLRTRQFDTPKGEFRFECQTCQSFNLCERCWDALQAGEKAHTAGHTFKTHHPREAQHNLNNPPSDSNPWGNFQGGASTGRALQRLSERHGISGWF